MLFTTDVDFLVEARRRQQEGQPFAGVVFARQTEVGIGTQIADLELLAKVATPEEFYNQVVFLPIR